MGFKRKGKEYRLSFADGEYEGLVVTLGSVTVGKMLEITKMIDSLQDKQAGAKASEQQELLFTTFAESLKSWNLENDDDSPVSADKSGVFEQDFDFILYLTQQWMKALNGVSDELGKDSTNINSSLEAHIPMVA